ncbi:MAG: DNA primase [Ndongobacter sp.]|nr:DNA primase [Ndongobacter sp.]
MGYISEHSVERIKSAVDIVSLIGEYVELKRSGSSYKACCPFHQEKTPSFVVSPSRGSYHCFGCHVHGDAIKFIMEMEHLDYPDALRFLADKYGIPIEEDAGDHPRQAHNKILYELNKQAMLFYYKNLLTQTVPQNYLKGRRMEPEMINRFFLGYADHRRDALYQHLTGLGFQKEDMLHLGLISQSNQGTGVYDRFRNRLMFPIISHRNRIIGFGGRIIGEGNPKYLNSPESDIFHKGDNLYGIPQLQKSTRKDEVILVEGYMDVIALHQFGIDIAAASLGTALTPEQAKLISRYGKQIFLCYDGDAAGVKAARRAIEVFAEQNIVPKLLLLPDGQDPDEFCHQHGVSAFEEQMAQGVDPVEFELRILAAGYRLDEAGSRLDFIRRATAFLADIPQEAVRDFYIQRVAQMVTISEEGLRCDVLEQVKRRKSAEGGAQGRSNWAAEPQPEWDPEYEPQYEEYGETVDGSDFQAVDFPPDLGKNRHNLYSERWILEYELIRLCQQSEECCETLQPEAERFVRQEGLQEVLHAVLVLRGQKISPEIGWLREALADPKAQEVLNRLEEEERRNPVDGSRRWGEVSEELKERIRRFELKTRRRELRQLLQEDSNDLVKQQLNKGDLMRELQKIDRALKAEGGGLL